MLQNPLNHWSEHLDDHHGPRPLSAVLGRERSAVSTGQGAPPQPAACRGHGMTASPTRIRFPWLKSAVYLRSPHALEQALAPGKNRRRCVTDFPAVNHSQYYGTCSTLVYGESESFSPRSAREWSLGTPSRSLDPRSRVRVTTDSSIQQHSLELYVWRAPCPSPSLCNH